jgi:hypothetical protein
VLTVWNYLSSTIRMCASPPRQALDGCHGKCSSTWDNASRNRNTRLAFTATPISDEVIRAFAVLSRSCFLILRNKGTTRGHCRTAGWNPPERLNGGSLLTRANGFRLDHAFATPSLRARVSSCRYSRAERDAGVAAHSMVVVEVERDGE